MREYHVYILASLSRRLYVGVTNDLLRRVYEHKTGAIDGFTKDFCINRLVHFEATVDVITAIEREKQVKRWTRARKYRLIANHNAGWLDLSADWYGTVIPHERSECRDPASR